MMRQARFSWPLALATAMLSAVGVQQAAAITYKATIINSVGYDYPGASGISGTSIVGFGGPTSGGAEAILWNTATNSVASLNPGPDWLSHGETFLATARSVMGRGAAISTLNDLRTRKKTLTSS